jgi:hypothetical protein
MADAGYLTAPRGQIVKELTAKTSATMATGTTRLLEVGGKMTGGPEVKVWSG